MTYSYRYTRRAVWKIEEFYMNVARKYRHTYSLDDMHKNISETVRNGFLIEKSLLRRCPTISRWQCYHMAHAGKWYYAYTITGNTITIEDACHEQNMHEWDLDDEE